MVFPIRTVTKPFSDFTKSYEIISSVIQKDISLWKLLQYKATAESYQEEISYDQTENSSTYKVTFVEADGTAKTKSFDRVEYSNRGKLLFNQITQSLDSMGHAISEQEKRQILMEILEKLC